MAAPSGVSVNWTETGGTITAGGLFTAGTTPGHSASSRPSRAGRADTASVTITAPPPTLTAVELTPASVSLTTGATQQFTAIGRMSDGSTSAVVGQLFRDGRHDHGRRAVHGRQHAGHLPGHRGAAGRHQGRHVERHHHGAGADATAVEVTPGERVAGGRGDAAVHGAGADERWQRDQCAVTWTETGGTITRSGLYTAGSTAGTFRVIAVQQGGTKADTASVTITAAAPTLSAVEVTPATVSLATGATQQFTAVGRMSDGSTQAVTVTWWRRAARSRRAGLYTAGSTAGSYRVIAVQQGGTKADTSAVTVTRAPPPPPSGGTADPSLLPLATGQAAVSASAYTALPYYSASGAQVGTNPRNMAVGSYYVDPTTGVKVVRLTSPTAPYWSSGMWMSGVDYAEGGLRVGRPSGTSYPIPVVSVGSGGGQGFRLITFDLSSYAVGLRVGSVPGGSAEIARAMSYVTPNVMYTIDGGVLRKWNVAGSTAVEIVSAPFPKDLRGHLHGQSSFTWFRGATTTAGSA